MCHKPQEQFATCSDMFPTISQMGRDATEHRTHRSMCCVDAGLPVHVDDMSLQDAVSSSNNINNGVAVDNASNGGTIDAAISV